MLWQWQSAALAELVFIKRSVVRVLFLPLNLAAVTVAFGQREVWRDFVKELLPLLFVRH